MAKPKSSLWIWSGQIREVRLERESVLKDGLGQSDLHHLSMSKQKAL